MQTPDKIVVFFDGSCPLCRREIDLYRNSDGADAICWTDVSLTSKSEVIPGLSKADAMSRFHVLTRGSEIVSGAEAFVTLWSSLPRFRFLACIKDFPLFIKCAEQVYVIFLKLRPSLQRLFSLLDERGK